MASEILRRLIPEDIDDLNKKLRDGILLLLIFYSIFGQPEVIPKCCEWDNGEWGICAWC